MKDKLIYGVVGFLVGNFLLGIVALGIFVYSQRSDSLKEITFEEVAVLHKSGSINKLRLEEDRVVVTTKDGQVFLRQAMDDDLGRKKVFKLAAEKPFFTLELASRNNSAPTVLLLQFAPIIGLVGGFSIIVLLIIIVVRLRPSRFE